MWGIAGLGCRFARSGDGRQRVGIIAQRYDRFQSHIAASDGPFVGLLQELDSDQAEDGNFILESYNDIWRLQ